MIALRFPITVALGTFLGAAATAADGQSGAPATIPFMDKTGGYELRLPAGWMYDRTGFFGPGGAIGLLRGLGPDGRTTCQVLLYRDSRKKSFAEWVEFFARQLGSVSGVDQVRIKGDPGAARPNSVVAVNAREGTKKLETYYACQAFDEETVWVFALTFVTPGGADADAPAAAGEGDFQPPAEFTAIVSSLRVFHSRERAREMSEALQRGKQFVRSFALQENIRKLRIDEAVRHYEIALGGRPIGYLTRQFTREMRGLDEQGRGKGGKEGLRVRERSWRFADDGSVRFTEVDLFSSVDGGTDLYEHNETIVPATAGAEIVQHRDQCVREGEVLFATFVTSQNVGRPTPRQPLKLDDTYVGLAWVRLLPALLGREPAEATGVTIYDSETRALITHTVRPMGEKACPGAGETAALFFETREGMLETPARVWTDKRGHLLRVEVGDLLVRASDEAAIERQFAGRRSAAAQRIAASASQPAARPGR